MDGMTARDEMLCALREAVRVAPRIRGIAAGIAILVPALYLGVSLVAFPSLALWAVALLFLAWGFFFVAAERLAKRAGI